MGVKLNLSKLESSVTVNGDQTASFSERKKQGLDQSMLKNMDMDESFYDMKTPNPVNQHQRFKSVERTPGKNYYTNTKKLIGQAV